MARIDLGGGAFATIDEADEVLVRGHRWYYRPAGKGQAAYAYTYIRLARGVRRLVPLHRLILGEPDTEIDHRNGDGLDNRRENLRLATRQQNAKNRPAQKDCKSPFKGVMLRRGRRGGISFVAAIQQDRERLKIGSFKSEHRAARAYDAAARLFHGRFARTNKEMGLFDLHPDRTTEDIHLV